MGLVLQQLTNTTENNTQLQGMLLAQSNNDNVVYFYI